MRKRESKRRVAGINSFLQVLDGEEPERIPVWFMRQAGRYLPEYQKVREGRSIQEICKDPSTVAEVTAQPVRSLGVEAGILFSDIMIPLEGMGFKVTFKEGVGPIIENSLRERPDMNSIRKFSSANLEYPVGESIRKFKELHPEVPLIGFTGGPITLLSYAANGRSDRDLASTKVFMEERKDTYAEAMGLISGMVSEYAKLQIHAGVDAVQVFDSWAGSLSPYAFSDYVDSFLGPSLQAIHREGKPLIYFGTGLAGHLDRLRDLSVDAISMDWRIRLSRVREAVGDRFVLQGNLDPVTAAGKDYVPETRRILEDIGNDKKFIFNLGHGVLPSTPPANLRSIVNYVHAFR